MVSTAKFCTTLAAFALAITALSGCTTTSAAPSADPSPAPTASHALEPGAAPASTDADADICPYYRATIKYDRTANPGIAMRVGIKGKLVDQGPREFAIGTVGLDDEGNIESYTVEAGDAPNAIGERLCMEQGSGLPMLNHVRTIYPGQVLRLRFDPDVPWVPYLNPDDAAAGFQQIPYQQAIEEMAAAGDVGDVDAMRAIWTNTLSGMFTNPADIDVIQQALDAGDPDVLAQMFS